MPTIPVDEELDPTELADQDQEETHDEGIVVVEEPAATDPDAEIVAEIDKVGVEEDVPAKQKAHMIPRHLIDAPLTADDLFDDGTI